MNELVVVTRVLQVSSIPHCSMHTRLYYGIFLFNRLKYSYSATHIVADDETE